MKRRDFIRNSVCAGLGAAASSGAIFDLQKILAATKVSANFTDYKALVCLFMYGGNDGDNTIVPRGAGYNSYSAQRTGLAIPLNEILPINPLNGDGREWGFHPRFTEMQSLFEQGKVAVLGNVGPLAVPTTRAQFQNNSVPLPLNLFSHNDQQVQWQTSVPDNLNVATGWAGRMADLISSANGTWRNFTSISLGGANTIGVGADTSVYHVSQYGTIGLNGYDDNPNTTDLKSQAINQILALNNANEFENEFRDINVRSINNNRVIQQALAATQPITTVFPDTNLGRQLKMIARLISARNNLTLQRQVFFCEIGGFDTHNEQVTTQPNLLQELSQAVGAFYAATNELGLADKVTTFTASDFGRSYRINGSGTDHAWGNHHFIIGGDVIGKRIYGQMPVLQIDGPNDSSDDGRWVPTTSTDVYAATLARWFGATTANFTTVLPNLSRFPSNNLGFMNVPVTVKQQGTRKVE
jgi:uncharacterized protein (DUF1501 family)